MKAVMIFGLFILSVAAQSTEQPTIETTTFYSNISSEESSEESSSAESSEETSEEYSEETSEETSEESSDESSSADSPVEICLEAAGADKEEFMKYMEGDNVPKLKCFPECVWKSEGSMSPDGTFNVDKAIENLPSDEQHRDKIIKALKSCSDKRGNDACETSILIHNCILEKL